MMASPDRALLIRLMALMAAGDRAALFPFIEEFGRELAGVVRRLLTSLNRPDIARNAEDVDYLVQSAALVLFDRAASWSPDGGALPWTWAERAIRAEIVSFLDHPAVELDSERHAAVDPAPVMATPDLLDLADEIDELGLLVAALAEVASERDTRVHLEYQVQKALGDREPANTVGHMFDLSPPNVRQIDRRVRTKLTKLRRSQSAFAALNRLSWVEAC